MNAIRRVRAVLKYSNKRDIALLLIIAKAIYAKMMASFRVNVTDTLTTTEWSQTVSILVH